MHLEFTHLFIAPDDFDRLVSFYEKGLGFKPMEKWGAKESPRGVVLQLGHFQVVIAEEHTANDSSWTGGVVAGRPTIHLSSDDFDDLYDRAKATTRIRVAPEKTHWGADWFVVEDTEGNLIAISRRQGDQTSD